MRVFTAEEYSESIRGIWEKVSQYMSVQGIHCMMVGYESAGEIRCEFQINVMRVSEEYSENVL